MPPYDPEVFGKYYLVDKIAVGGMAEIFKAKTFSHGGFEKLLVIKRILSHLSENEEFVSMFIDEAKISVSLQHASIVQIYDFGKIQDNYFIAMEWVDGKDVKQILRKLASRRKLLPEEFAVFIAHETCKALDFAHKKTDLKDRPLGIIHRDVSPSNLLVSYSGEVKIADFGIAKAQFSAYNTKDGVLKGKFEYMSPEQARGEELTPRSDLFSAGIILYEMLTGRRLFKTESELATLEKVKAAEIQPPSSLNPNIPPRLDALVMRALAKAPEDRYRDAGELQAALLEYMYPSTPTVTQKSLTLFMKELFAEERQSELERLEQGSELARSLHSKVPDLFLDDDWEEGEPGEAAPAAGATTPTLHQPPAHGGRSPLLLTLLASALVISIAAFYLIQSADRGPGAGAPTAQVDGSLHIQVTPPEARILDGAELLGAGPKLVVPLSPGLHTLHIEAPGYVAAEYEVRIASGERVLLPVTLLAEPAAEGVEGGATEGAEGEATGGEATEGVEGEATGGGATEGVEGEATEGEATEATEAPQRGSAPPPEAAAPDEPEATGRLNVNVSGGWAYIYVDGQRLAETTPLSGYTLPAGEHTVRVVNEASGLDQSRSVRVEPDGTARVSFEAN